MIRWLGALGLLLAPAVAHADWYEASTPHFVVYANDNADHLQGYATKLERFDRAMRVLRDVPDRTISANERVTVYVVHDDSVIGNLIGDDAVRGFYHASVGGAVAFVPRSSGSGDKWDLDADSVLRHEYSHHFMFDNYDNLALPLWYVEGFAEFHATAVSNDDGSVVFGQAPRYRAHALFDSDALSIADVLTADQRRMDGQQVDTLYGKGWLLLHYLTFEPSRRGQLVAYLAAINTGKSPADAAKTFGDLKALDRELMHYAHRQKITVKAIPASAITVQPATLRKLSAGEAAMMAIRIRSKAGVDNRTAVPLFARATKVAAPFPNDPGAQLVLAEAACAARDYAACLAAANRVLTAAPGTEKAYVFQGRALMAIAASAPKHDTTAFHVARKSFSTANHLDQNEPEALFWYYQSFSMAGENPTDNARAALRKALDFAPEDANLRMATAIDFLHGGDKPAARATLLPLAYSPHGGGDGRKAAALVAAIDKNDDAAIDHVLHPPKPDDGKDKSVK